MELMGENVVRRARWDKRLFSSSPSTRPWICMVLVVTTSDGDDDHDGGWTQNSSVARTNVPAPFRFAGSAEDFFLFTNITIHTAITLDQQQQSSQRLTWYLVTSSSSSVHLFAHPPLYYTFLHWMAGLVDPHKERQQQRRGV